MLYSELQCSEAIHKAVERMGFAEMTEIQEKTIPVMLAGRDVIAKAPTGTGKTCAFGIPVAEHIDPEKKYPQAVIMAPTRELAQQIAEELTELTYFMPEVQVACVYGGANMEKQARRLAEGCQIVVATPGRLMDHYKHHSIDLAHVTQVVLDEADEMLNMGFYKDVRHIIELMKARKSLSMFSATIDGGGEHGQAFAGLHQLNDMPHILIKAHVQHLIGLVQHHLGHMGQIDAVVLIVVHQAARGGHHDLAALCQTPGLLFHVGTAVHAGHLHLRHKVGQLGQLLGDLLGKLPGGGHDHSLRVLFFRVDMFRHRDAEGTGLAGAGGGFGDHIPACQHHRDGLFLNFRHLCKPHPLHGLVDGFTALQLTVKHV